MKDKSSESKVVAFEISATRLQRTRLVKQLQQDQQRHLVVELNSRHIATLINFTDDIGSLLQDELRLWRQILGPRRVDSLELHFCSDVLEPFQITGLIHRLAAEFHLQNPTYRVIFQTGDADPEVLALFKGLAFDHCQFSMEHAESENLDMLRYPVTQAKAFQFSKIGIQLMHSEGVENLTRSIKNIQKNFDPDYIFIGCSTLKLRPKDVSAKVTLFEDDLLSARLDYLSLGPESQSRFNGETIDAVSDPRRYVNAIKSGLLPINELGLASTTS